MTAIICIAVCGFFPEHDNNVEWDGVSHVAWQDRRPVCPVDREAFSVLFQAFRNDITSARVRVDDGAPAWIDAVFDHDRGPYAVWRAELPASGAARLSYYIALTDGADTDYLSVSGMSDDPPADGGFVLDFDTLEHAPVGATPISGGGTVFKVWAPTSAQAFVRGQFNGWTLANPMSRVGRHFIARIPDALDRQQYKYFFRPGDVWKPDARARSLNASDNLNSHIEDPFRYAWSDGGFRAPAFEDMIIYELHVGTFAGRNDNQASGAIPATYADVAVHADHLAELGVNVVELTPVTEFPWDFSAGYNPISQWAPEWKYGEPDELKAMVDVLHRNGIAVILDIVWNHFSPTDNYLWFYDGTQIYFDSPHVDTPWGAQADFDRGPVRDYFAHSGLYWLEELHMDGYRMDATEFMDIQAGGWSLMQRLNDTIDNRWVDKISIAEQLPDNPWITRPSDLGGAGFDAQWHDAFVDNLRQEILDAAFGDPEMWKIRNIINGSGTYLEKSQVVNYLELHDEAWPSSGGSRLVKIIDPTFPHDDLWAKGRTKLGQGIVMFAPGIPAILQGAEWLEDTDFGGGSPSGDDRIDWSKRTRNAAIFRYFKDMIAVRKSNPALRANASVDVAHLNESDNVIAFHRFDGDGSDIVVVANFGNADRFEYRIGLPLAGRWQELLNSQAVEYDGNGLTNSGGIESEPIAWDGFAQSAAISLPQMGLLVFGPESCNPCDMNCDGLVNAFDIEPFLDLLFDGGVACDTCAGDVNADGDIDAFDIEPFLNCLFP